MTSEKITLYVGLNDQEKRVQVISTIEAFKIVQNILVNTCGGGTVYECTGIYKHENGEIIIEKSLRIEIFGAGAADVNEAARLIKIALNQESIIMQREIVNSELV